jgi:hypothetical protein
MVMDCRHRTVPARMSMLNLEAAATKELEIDVFAGLEVTLAILCNHWGSPLADRFVSMSAP